MSALAPLLNREELGKKFCRANSAPGSRQSQYGQSERRAIIETHLDRAQSRPADRQVLDAQMRVAGPVLVVLPFQAQADRLRSGSPV
jgi:hypothetical protein